MAGSARCRWYLVYSLGTVLLVLGCGPGPKPDLESEARAAGKGEAVAATPHGRWRVEEEPAQAEAYGDTSTFAPPASFDEELSLSLRIQPLLETREDLSGLLLSEQSLLAPGLGQASIFQTVPGVPDDPRYGGDKFDPIRDGFAAECIEQAGKYTEVVGSLTASWDLSKALSAAASGGISDYERQCLTSLSQVPTAVQQVIGVLALDGGTFCSATIVGPKRLVTSRHCFFDSRTGAAEVTWHALYAKRVAFYSAVSHSGQRIFSALPDGTPQASGFSPADDHLLLKVQEGPFNAMARIPDSPLEELQLPRSAWVVGSNALLGDVTKLEDPFFFVRGSAPPACAILERTAAGCLYHTCQTGGSTSGAGVLEPSGGGVILRGVHKGPVALAGGCEDSPPLALDMNLGAQFLTDDLGT